MCTSSGVHSQNGSQQPGDHNLESLLVVRLALAGSGELSYSCSSKLAPSICALARGFLLSPCRCSLQGCLSKSDAAWDRSCQQNVTFELCRTMHRCSESWKWCTKCHTATTGLEALLEIVLDHLLLKSCMLSPFCSSCMLLSTADGSCCTSASCTTAPAVSARPVSSNDTPPYQPAIPNCACPHGFQQGAFLT